MSDIVYRYDEKKNPHGDVLDRVPLRDVTAAEWKEMPDDLRANVAACTFFVKVPKTAEKPKTAAAKPAEKEGDK